eukprot:30664-Pelagococcus_subviridis.AAC.6
MSQEVPRQRKQGKLSNRGDHCRTRTRKKQNPPRSSATRVRRDRWCTYIPVTYVPFDVRTELILDEVERVDAERGEKTAETPDQGAFQRRTVHDVPTRVPRMFSQPAPSMLDGTFVYS